MHAVKSTLLGILVASLAANALAGTPEYGIASRYLRDVAIENDPHVVFTENFESGSVDELVRRWGCTACYTWPEHMSFASDVPATSGGQRSYRSDGPTDLYK
ncbi:MAG: hypothetical protein K1X64_23675, partial [Myxococcaceae bacterium]|nr:hypothetical protein [Myxococcaceae bacterium]